MSAAPAYVERLSKGQVDYARYATSLMASHLSYFIRGVDGDGNPGDGRNLDSPYGVPGAWHIVEPTVSLKWNWHLEEMCNFLAAIEGGEIRNGIINIPPRFMKSLTVSVFWFCQSWIFNPHTRWIFASYAETLSVRDSVKCRRILESLWYKTLFGGAFKITSDQNQKTRFENDKTGLRMATSVAGVGTGEGGDFTIIDDPHNVKEIESEAKRSAVLDWHDHAFFNRAGESGRRVVIMQRSHEKDLVGHLIDKAEVDWDVMTVPMNYDTEAISSKSFIDIHDPRTETGELLWPARFDEKEAESLERTLGPSMYQAQYNQNPTPSGGLLFKVRMFEVVDKLPADEHLIAEARGWDKAGTKKETSKFTAGVKVGALDSGAFVVQDVIRDRWTVGERESEIRFAAHQDGVDCRVRMEQEPGSAGVDVASISVRQLAGFDVDAVRSTDDKPTRATPAARQVEWGNVYVLRRSWTDAFIEECRKFPRGTYTDQVDAFAVAFNDLALDDGLFESRELRL